MRVQFRPLEREFVSLHQQNNKQVTFKSVMYNPKSIVNRNSSVARYLFSLLRRSVAVSRILWLAAGNTIKPYIKEVEMPNSKQKSIVRLWDIGKNNQDNINNQKYVIIMHGFGHNISCLQDLYDKILNKTNYNILAQEYSGFRECDNGYKYVRPKYFLQDAEIGLKYLKDKGIKEQNICLLGHSFGGYVAAKLAAKHKNIGSMILVSPCYSMRSMTERIIEGYDTFVPQKIEQKLKTNKFYHIMADRVFSMKKPLKHAKSKVDIIHSEQDRYVKLKVVQKLAKYCANLHKFNILSTGHHKMDDEKIKAIITSLNQLTGS